MSAPGTDRGASPEVLRFSRRRRVLTWLWFFTTLALFAGILVFANLIVARLDVSVDLTMERLHSINPNTKTLLSRIDRDVTIYLTYLRNANTQAEEKALPQAWQQLKRMVDEFSRANPAHITVKTIADEKDPVIFEIQSHFQTTAANTVYIVCSRGEGQAPNKRSVPISEIYEGDRLTGALKAFTGEARIGAALLQATQDGRRTIYYTTGHKEMIPSTANDGFGLVQRNLEALHNGVLKELDFPRTPAVPGDADVLLVPGPSVDFEPRELDALESFLDGGGRAFVMLEVGKCPELGKVLEKWGIRPNADIVLDPAYPADARYVRVRQFGEHEINAGMRNVSFPMPNTRSLTLLDNRDPKRTVIPLMGAPRDAWAQPVTRERPTAEPDDPRSPCVAAAVSAKVEKPRDPKRPAAKLVVWGSMVAFSNWNLKTSQGGVREDYVNFILNHFRWLMDEEGMISAMPMRLERKPLELTNGQNEILFWTVIVAMPAIGVILGMVAWLFRRS